MDKIFGYDNFVNEVLWLYTKPSTSKAKHFPRASDTILFYARNKGSHKFNADAVRVPYDEKTRANYKRGLKGSGTLYDGSVKQVEEILDERGKIPPNWWELAVCGRFPKGSPNNIGYPTQKPEKLLARIIEASTDKNDLVADFFIGGGTTAAVAQNLNRSWIACDQSRVAVAVTADRLTRQVEEKSGKLFSVPDFTVEHWGVYEARRLADMPAEQFRGFVLKCFGATVEEQQPGIHGMKGAVPVWVGDPNPKRAVTSQQVQDYANAIRKTVRYQQDNLRDGLMLAWAFRPDALEAAERLRRLEQTDLNFIRLEQVRIDSPRFREHVAALSTDHADYENFLTFVQPPRVEVGHKRIAALTYIFDVSESVVLNSGGKIINVQWDFDYSGRFSSTPGFSFVRGGKLEPQLQVQYQFPRSGEVRVACKVQDDMGGEGLWSEEIGVK
jgi:hypothetical protein